MTTFYSFALKTEASWAKKLVKPILEIWNANDVIVYVWFIHESAKKKGQVPECFESPSAQVPNCPKCPTAWVP